MVKPTDLPGFGTLPDNFIETKSKLIVPKAVDPNGPIESLETPDQLGQRQENSVSVILTEQEYPPEPKVETNKMDPSQLREKHPEWTPNTKFQSKLFYDLIKLNEIELKAVKDKMDGLEILLDLYPLLSSVDDLQEFRRLLKRNLELTGEKVHLLNMIMEMNRLIQPQTDSVESKPIKRNWFSKLFKR